MDPSGQFCPNFYCLHRGKPGLGNIRANSRTERRYRCATFGKTNACTLAAPLKTSLPCNRAAYGARGGTPAARQAAL